MPPTRLTSQTLTMPINWNFRFNPTMAGIFPFQTVLILFFFQRAGTCSGFAVSAGRDKKSIEAGGHCVHLMPTGAWRFWTSVAHYTKFFQRLFGLAPRLILKGLSKHALSESISVLRLIADSVFRNPCQGSMRKLQRRLQII